MQSTDEGTASKARTVAAMYSCEGWVTQGDTILIVNIIDTHIYYKNFSADGSEVSSNKIYMPSQISDRWR